MDSLSRGELLPKVVEAYSRPTRIVRGKEQILVDAEVSNFKMVVLFSLIFLL